MNFPKPQRVMPALIALVLLTYFGLSLFGKAIWGQSFATDSNMVQTLVNLTIAAVMYYVGTTAGSAKKDETIATLGGAPTPPVDSVVAATTTKTTTSTTSSPSPQPLPGATS